MLIIQRMAYHNPRNLLFHILKMSCIYLRKTMPLEKGRKQVEIYWFYCIVYIYCIVKFTGSVITKIPVG